MDLKDWRGRIEELRERTSKRLVVSGASTRFLIMHACILFVERREAVIF
jgi:hypothetical protein